MQFVFGTFIRSSLLQISIPNLNSKISSLLHTVEVPQLCIASIHDKQTEVADKSII